MFFNCCIKQAMNRPKITPDMLKRAEAEYSRNRLSSLADEWISDYPNLLFFSKVLRNRRRTFLASDIHQEELEEICLNFCISWERTQESNKEDVLSTSARDLINITSDYANFRNRVLKVFHNTGLIGIKTQPTEKTHWASIDARNIPRWEISEQSKIAVHPMFWRALGINVR